MGMTMVEKIIAAHTEHETVKPGQIVNARVDMILGNDVTTPVAIREIEKTGVDKVIDKDRIAIVPDHFTPNKDIKSAEQERMIREFARKQGIANYFEETRMAIEHCLLP